MTTDHLAETVTMLMTAAIYIIRHCVSSVYTSLLVTSHTDQAISGCYTLYPVSALSVIANDFTRTKIKTL